VRDRKRSTSSRSEKGRRQRKERATDGDGGHHFEAMVDGAGRVVEGGGGEGAEGVCARARRSLRRGKELLEDVGGEVTHSGPHHS
jgi:hypothetical protein